MALRCVCLSHVDVWFVLHPEKVFTTFSRECGGDSAQRTSTEQEDVAAIYGCDTDKVDLGPTTKVDKSRYLL